MGQPRHRHASDRVFDHPFLSLRRDHFRDPAGESEKVAYLIEIADWVNVVAFDSDQQVLMVSQFRYGTRSITLEIPGGAIDAGETPLAAARRELMEETGYEATDWREVGTVEPNPAIQGNRCTTFVATGLRRTADFDAEEIDGISFIPFSEVRRQIRAGEIQHALVIAAVHFTLEFIEGGLGGTNQGRAEVGSKGSEGAGL